MYNNNRGTTQIAFLQRPLERPVTGAKRKALLGKKAVRTFCLGATTAGLLYRVSTLPGSLQTGTARTELPRTAFDIIQFSARAGGCQGFLRRLGVFYSWAQAVSMAQP